MDGLGPYGISTLKKQSDYYSSCENLEGMFKTDLAQGIESLGSNQAFCLLL